MGTTETTRGLLEAAEQDSKGLILPKSMRDFMRHARNVLPAYVRVAEAAKQLQELKRDWMSDFQPLAQALADLEALEDA